MFFLFHNFLPLSSLFLQFSFRIHTSFFIPISFPLSTFLIFINFLHPHLHNIHFTIFSFQFPIKKINWVIQLDPSFFIFLLCLWFRINTAVQVFGCLETGFCRTSTTIKDPWSSVSLRKNIWTFETLHLENIWISVTKKQKLFRLVKSGPIRPCSRRTGLCLRPFRSKWLFVP